MTDSPDDPTKAAPPAWEFADFKGVEPVCFTPGMELTADLLHKFANYQAARVAATAPPPGLRADDRGVIDRGWEGTSDGELRLNNCAVRTSRGFHLRARLMPPEKLAAEGEHLLWFGYDGTAWPVLRWQALGTVRPPDMPVDLGFIGVRKKGTTVSPELANAVAAEQWDVFRERFVGLVEFYHRTGYKAIPSDVANTPPLATGVDAGLNYPNFVAVDAAMAMRRSLEQRGVVSLRAAHEAAVAVVASITRVPVLVSSAAPDGLHFESALDDAFARVPVEYQDFQRIFEHFQQRLAGREPKRSCQLSYVAAGTIPALTRTEATTILVHPNNPLVGFRSPSAVRQSAKLSGTSREYVFFSVPMRDTLTYNGQPGAMGNTILRLDTNLDLVTQPILDELVRGV